MNIFQEFARCFSPKRRNAVKTNTSRLNCELLLKNAVTVEDCSPRLMPLFMVLIIFLGNLSFCSLTGNKNATACAVASGRVVVCLVADFSPPRFRIITEKNDVRELVSV